MNPHSFSLMDPDPHSICESGSRRENFSNENRKNARKLVIDCKFVQIFYLHCFLLLSNLLCILQLKKTFHKGIFKKFV